MHTATSIPPFEIMTWHELRDALYQRERTRDIVQTEKTVQPREANIATNRRVQEYALKLRAEIDFAILKTVIKRLDAYTVASENEAAFGPHPDRDRKHSSQPGKARATPAQEGVEDNLGVAPRFKSKSLRFQLSSQFRVVKNLSIEDYDYIAVRTE